LIVVDYSARLHTGTRRTDLGGGTARRIAGLLFANPTQDFKAAIAPLVLDNERFFIPLGEGVDDDFVNDFAHDAASAH
jgi:hypothetical protein